MDFYHGIIPCYYAIAMDTFNTIIGHTKPSLAKEVVVVSTIIPVLALVFVSMIPFLLWYGFVHIFLTLKHGNQYGGILPGSDVVHEVFDPKFAMNLVLIISHDGTEEELIKDMKIAFERLHNSHYKFSSVIKSFCGYFYYLKNQIHIDEVVVPVKFSDSKHITKEELYINLEKHQYRSKNGDVRLWETKICLQPILWNDESRDKNHYALILRVNHSVCDGMSFFVYLRRYLCCEPLEITASKKNDVPKTLQKKPIVSANIHKLPFGDVSDYYLKPPHEGSDHRYVFVNETEAKYLPILKRLKTKYNTSITSVIATGATEIISKYLKRKSINQDNIFFAQSCRSPNENIVDILTGKKFGNESVGIMTTLPLLPRATAVEKLKEVSNVVKKMTCSVDGQCLYVGMKLATYLPAVFHAYVFDLARVTLGITNVPVPEMRGVGSATILNIFGFINYFHEFKFNLVVLSHKGVLQVGLTARSGMVETREELQEMLHDILKYIDKLDEESESSSSINSHDRLT